MSFHNPPTAYRLAPFWFWNDDLDPEEIVHQIQQMAEQGIGGFFICARQGLTIPYLSNQWFQFVAIAIKAPQTGKLQSGIQEGYPYFAGILSFTKDISIETLPHTKTFALALHGLDPHIHDCVEILINGHSLGVCCWSPYRWEGESAILHAGMNTVEIRLTNTLSTMLEGSYFDDASHQIIPITKSE